MKTAISIPDDVFDAADDLAAELGVSRSELYARAVEEYVAKHRQQDITRQLNAVHAAEAGGLELQLRRAQTRTIEGAEW